MTARTRLPGASSQSHRLWRWSFTDLSNSPYNEDNYQHLLKTLYEKRETPPPIGKSPAFEDTNFQVMSKHDISENKTSGKTNISQSNENPSITTKSRFPAIAQWCNTPLFILVGFVASLFAILTFTSGKQNIFEFFPTRPLSGIMSTATFTLTSQPIVSSQTLEIVQPTAPPNLNITLTETTVPTSSSLPTEITNAKGVSMVLVPAGEFVMGASPSLQREMLALCQSCDPTSVTDQSPQCTIYLDDFWIDKTEVTIAQFQEFVESENYITTAEKKGSSLLFNRSTKKYTTTSGVNGGSMSSVV